MRSVHILLCFCSSFLLLLAYPVDYDETTYGAVEEAQNELLKIINNTDFEAQLEQYDKDISEIDNKTYTIIIDSLYTFSKRIVQVKQSANNLDINITVCLKDLDFTVDEFYKFYINDCGKAAVTFRESIIELGKSEGYLALKKYEEIANYFNDCVNFDDPDPRICAGVLESTSIEINRIKPVVEATPLRFERELKQEILEVEECGYRHTVVTIKKLRNEFDKARMCVLGKINAA